MENKDYGSLFISLKEHIKNAQQKAILSVNAQLLFLYWEVGSFIIQQKNKLGWGAKVVKQLANDLKSEFPNIKGFSERNLKNMVRFAETYPLNEIGQTLVAQIEKEKKAIGKTVSAQIEKKAKIELTPAFLNNNFTFYDFLQLPISKITWSHHLEIIKKTDSIEERNYYLKRTIKEGWSYRILSHQIEMKLFERQGKITNNFDKTLPPKQSELVKQTLKDKYVFDFLTLKEEAKEKELENALLKEITKFLLELGKGFAFLGQQYLIEVGGKPYRIDLLFFHTILNCHFIIELKMDEFEPEFAGKLDFYITAINKEMKHENHNNTIGLLLCKSANKVVAEYSLETKTQAMGVATYDFLPKEESFIELLKQKEK